MDVKDRLTGSWSLADWKVFDGEEAHDVLPPLGLAADCGGLLIYSADGWMSATMSRKDRPPFAGTSVDGGSPQERADAFATYVSYCGEYSVDEAAGQVTHHVHYATNPNFVGKDLMRICLFKGNLLRLDTPPMMIGGKMRSSHIDWVRN